MHAVKTKFAQQQLKIRNLTQRIFNGKSLNLAQTTPYQVIAELDHTRVRYYAAEHKKYLEPLVFTAPLAVNMSIYDLYPYRSLVRYFQSQGFDVYLIDWGELTYRNHAYNFLTFIDDLLPHCIQAIRLHSGADQISLHGWSMAGIFVTLYTALHQPNYVKNLIVLGSPIDSYKSGVNGKFFKNLNQLISKNKTLQQKVYQGLIPKRFLHTPGLVNAIGFKILDPVGWLNSHKNLLRNLDDQEALYEHATISSFLNHMVDYPGGINQDMLFNVWLQNPLKQGKIHLQNRTIELKNIQSSLLVGAGTSDQLVTTDAAQPLCELTNSHDVTFTLIPGGHLGLMSNNKSASEFWPKLSNWLSERSTPIV